jgi:aromatic ring-opening dioxygenase catalytic subunit (LigB family)
VAEILNRFKKLPILFHKSYADMGDIGMSNTEKLPTYFISHGGGPWPWFKDKSKEKYLKLEAALQDMPRQLGEKPKAILMISAHWEEREFTVMTNPKPPMVYDYGGFPEYLYHIDYPAPGSPELSWRVQELLTPAGISVRTDAVRGFDHGMYAPLKPVYPDADVPVVQLSLRSDYDPRAHIELGRALTPLRNEGILILGSGLSFHNFALFGRGGKIPSQEFDAWLQETLVSSSPEVRTRSLIEWEKAPSARLAHAQEDHLIPLLVAVGAAESEIGQMVYHEDEAFGGLSVSGFRFG